MFNIYLKKAAEIYGVTKTRAIYEKVKWISLWVALIKGSIIIVWRKLICINSRFQAIELLGDTEARQMSMRFAELETKLGEIDRARAIYSHCSQMCDPRLERCFAYICSLQNQALFNTFMVRVTTSTLRGEDILQVSSNRDGRILTVVLSTIFFTF